MITGQSREWKPMPSSGQSLPEQVQARLNRSSKEGVGIVVFDEVAVDGPVHYLSVAAVYPEPHINDLSDVVKDVAESCSGLGKVVPIAFGWDNTNLYLGRVVVANVVVVCIYPNEQVAKRYVRVGGAPHFDVRRDEVSNLRFR